jgi:renalase
MPSVAIIGAGSSGLAAAHTLQDAASTVTVFEQGRDVGGRATTRKREGFIYDHGANYIKPGSSASTRLS